VKKGSLTLTGSELAFTNDIALTLPALFQQFTRTKNDLRPAHFV
jgi:hypothetical protein